MRILFVCTDAEIGGAERFLVTLAHAKMAEDTLALVVLMKPGALSNQLEDAFDEVYYLGFAPSSRNIVGMVQSLKSVVRRFKPEIVSSHLFHADLVTLLSKLNTPKTSTVHTQGFGEGDHPLTRIIARVVGSLSSGFAAVIPTSDTEQMKAFIRKLRMKHVVAAINNSAAVPEQYNYKPESRTFISLARNHPVKGHLNLLKAFVKVAASTSEWKLVAYGTDVTAENVQMAAAIRDANATALLESGRIILGGAIEKPEVELAHASALVISSIHGEAFPIVGAEAAGLGIPVITTDLGSCSEFVDDERFLVKPDDVDSLATALQIFIDLNDEEREKLSKQARERAEENYHPSVAYARYRRVFSNALQKRTS